MCKYTSEIKSLARKKFVRSRLKGLESLWRWNIEIVDRRTVGNVLLIVIPFPQHKTELQDMMSLAEVFAFLVEVLNCIELRHLVLLLNE